MEPRIPSVSVVYDRDAFLYGVLAGGWSLCPKKPEDQGFGHKNEGYVPEKDEGPRFRSHTSKTIGL